MTDAVHELPRAAVDAKLVALIKAAAVGLCVLLSGFVLREPAPYEIYMAGLIAVWALFGLRISRQVAPLLVLLVVFNVGGMIAMTQLSDLDGIPLYLAVSLFLAFTAVFFAAVTEAEPYFLPLIFKTWVAAATLTALAGVGGYFGIIPGAELFTRYGRAAGVFQDPNVFGPFLVPPALYLVHRILTGSGARIALCAPALLVIAAGIFLSFSRGAWGLFALTTILLTLAILVHHASGIVRLRIMALGLVAIALLAAGAIAMLQIPGVGTFFLERAQFAQEYDVARFGRFARYGIGFAMAMENPLGIGPLAFGKMLGEDTHNIWLKALLAYSWLGFAAFFALIAWTFAAGFRILFRDRPWQPYLLCAYIALVGHVALGTIIDLDHWRHFYLLLGLVWGCMALEARHQRKLAGRRGLNAGALSPSGK